MAEAKYNAAEHKALRARYRKDIDAGRGWCTEPTCLMPTRYIPPGSPFDVPHTEDGTSYRGGPAHTRCNRADGGRRRHQPNTPPPPRRRPL